MVQERSSCWEYWGRLVLHRRNVDRSNRSRATRRKGRRCVILGLHTTYKTAREALRYVTQVKKHTRDQSIGYEATSCLPRAPPHVRSWVIHAFIRYRGTGTCMAALQCEPCCASGTSMQGAKVLLPCSVFPITKSWGAAIS